MLQKQLKEYVVGRKTRKAQPHILNSSEYKLSSPPKKRQSHSADICSSAKDKTHDPFPH